MGTLGMRRRPERVWKSWVVRGLVFGLLGLAATIGSLFWAWTSPGLLREAVVQEIQRGLPAAQVDLESASMRLLGGITLRDLRLSKRNDLARTDFFHVPLAVLYHDKEQLIEGTLAIRKAELKGPRMKLVRGRDGIWNLTSLQGGGGLNLAGFPTIVVERGSLLIEDHGPSRASARAPLGLEIRDLSLLAMNDPPGKLRVEANGTSDLLGPVRLTWSHQRQGDGWTCRVEIPEIVLGLDTNELLMAFLPENISGQLRVVSGMASVILEGESMEALGAGQWKATISVRDVELSVPMLPWPVKSMNGNAVVSGGRLKSLSLKGTTGNGRLEARASDVGPPTGAAWTDVARLEGTWGIECSDMVAASGVLSRCPWPCPVIETMFKPSGTADISYRHELVAGASSGTTRDVIEVRPRGARGTFLHFPYPFTDASGLVRAELRGPTPSNISVNMQGKASGAPLSVTGNLKLHPGAWGINMSLTAKGIPLNRELLAAIPSPYDAIAAQFHPEGGSVDVDAGLMREPGNTLCANKYVVGVSGTSLRHDAFPLPLSNVRGTIEVRPDGWECRDFAGEHKGGSIRAAGRDVTDQGSTGGFRLVLRGENIPAGEELRTALVAQGVSERGLLGDAVRALGLSGRLGFDADVTRKMVPIPEVLAEVALRGATMTPKFLPCQIEDVQMVCRYSKDRVHIRDLAFKRGVSRVKAAEGVIQLRQDGGYRARLEKIEASPLVLDDELIAALSPGPRRAVQAIGLKDPVWLSGALGIESNPDSGPSPVVDWEGTARLDGASIKAGLEFSQMTGTVACQGKYNGHAMESLAGQAVMERALAGGQPVSPGRARFEVRADTPDTLRFWDLQGEIFGGVIGGQGRVEFSARPRFELDLRATRVNLAQAAAHNRIDSSEIQGLGHAWLRLGGEVHDLGSLRGEGALDVPQARMYQLPVFLDLVKALGLRVPDRTAFEQARARYTVEGAQVQFQRLDLFGNAISLRGTGTVGLEDLDTRLDFHVDLARLNQLLPAVVDEIPKAVSNQLLTLRVRGKPGNLRFDKELLPALNDPLRRFVESRQP